MTESIPMDKAVILARGRGTRMRQDRDGARLIGRQVEMADAGIKAMIPIDRPFLDYVLSNLADAGFRRVCLVIGPEHDVVRDYYTRRVQLQRLEIEFAVQKQARGTADAVLAAESFVEADPFLVINSDNFYPLEAYRALRRQSESATALFEREALLRGGNISAERIARFAVCEIDEHNRLRRIVEKPDERSLAEIQHPLFVSMNVWRFEPTIFRACRSIEPSVRGEFELVSAVQHAIDVQRTPFHVELIHAPVLDLTTRDDVAAVAAHLAGMKVRL